ncbi:hypothetical protein PsorP6_017443 [Peronosclerospora sorghi]|uniref:Uncharacterized protein n=1 Tax=Peronosclerospora sorghi TaxID=230839 RepID=A0ACC0WNL8_9STRA|nr:hypothetical protein PsorP6_017443 [Peronosclerospora sorghi]
MSLWKINPVEVMILALRKKRDFQTLDKTLVKAQERGGNAEILKKLQFELWEQSGVDILVHLKLDSQGANMFQSPNYKTWRSYLNYAKERAKEKSRKQS